MTFRVLVIGKDARTDSIAAACARSPRGVELYGFTELPLPGLVDKCREVHEGSLTDLARLADVVRRVRPHLAVVGPEEPLEAGVVDALQRLGVPAFGPTRRLAAIEASKAWARDLLDRNEIAGNPEYRVFDSADGLAAYMEELGTFVIKPDGLTAGKGVRVFGEHMQTVGEAYDYAEAVLASDGRVLIEERLEGEEFSLQTITDGETVVHCPPVQDHKRAYEGDAGPNTGGMGSYSCADHSMPFLTPDELAEAKAINERVIEELASETGEPYRGVLYGGFMATADGIRLIEYNSRFGDPEAMNVLPLLDADFVEVCEAVATGTLSRVPVTFLPKATVCKYVVPAAYPQPTAAPGRIVVPEELRDAADLKWFWAACRDEDGQVSMTSSRAGAFVGIGDSLAEAERVAEAAARQVRGDVRHRPDIGRADVVARRVSHMDALRSTAARALSAAG